jgi:cytochrome b6-f complex iron-sulfur subunit
MQCLSAKSSVVRPVQARKASRAPVVVRAAAVSGDVPDMNKRNVMNLLLAGAIGLPVTGLAGPFALFFVPPR